MGYGSTSVVRDWDQGVSVYFVVVPARPDCTSPDDTVAEYLASGREVIALDLGVLKQRGEPIPDAVPTQANRIEMAA